MAEIPAEPSQIGDVKIDIDVKEHLKIDVKESNNNIMENNNQVMSDLSSLPSKDIDEVVPADELVQIKIDGAVKLRMEKSGVASAKPITVQTFFTRTCMKYAKSTAMAIKRNGKWQKYTYSKYFDDVKKAAKSFIWLGLRPFASVCIIGFNSPEWFISSFASIFAGGISSGIYATNSPEACEYIVNDCQAEIVVCENDAQLQKFIQIKDNIPEIKAFVQYSGEVKEEVKREHSNVYSWEEFLRIGSDVTDSALNDRSKLAAPNKCSTLIYTSGTTGNPKGVMLSHDNLTWTGMNSITNLGLLEGKEILISYLPLSHIAAQLLDMYVVFSVGAAVYFAQPDALKGSLSETLKEVKPTIFFGVPRVWEKMMEKMKSIGAQSTGFKKKVALWGKDIGLRGNYSKMKGGSVPWGWTIAEALVFKKVQAALGFTNMRRACVAAAPITKETLEFFLSFNIPILEIFGMSECSGPQSFNFPGQHRVTSCGKSLLGTQLKAIKPDEDGNGELCMFGRNVFMGYLNQAEKTAEALDSEGWLHSGDLAKLDDDQYLYITGRIKELIITAGGENIGPVPIEEDVKKEVPIISNCMLIGDKKKFLSMIMTLKSEVNMDTMEPLDQLTKEANDWCKSVGSTQTTVSGIVNANEECVMKAIQAGIDKVNSRSLSRAQKIQKWAILPHDFSIPTGELGPTLKTRRPIVHKMYAKKIDGFYE